MPAGIKEKDLKRERKRERESYRWKGSSTAGQTVKLPHSAGGSRNRGEEGKAQHIQAGPFGRRTKVLSPQLFSLDVPNPFTGIQ